MNNVKMISAVGKEQGFIDLGFNFSDADLSPKTYACAVRVLLQNWRQGTVASKTRCDLAFSNKKPWKQKGTGRARAGSLKSPLWRKGAVLFGPQARVKVLKINRRQRQLCLKNLFAMMATKGAIYCVDCDFNNGESPKTKKAFGLLKNMGMDQKKGLLFLPYEDAINTMAFRNIPAMSILSFDQANVFDLSGTDYWLFLKKDLELFKGMVAKWA